MNELCREVLSKLKGKTLVSAESCTGGGIGAALTAIPGSSEVYKGGVISYCDEIKEKILGVSRGVLEQHGAVSASVAESMACGVRKLCAADVAVSVTGLAGPDGDEFGNPVGTVYIGYEDNVTAVTKEFYFDGDRDSVRNQTIAAALNLILEYNP